MIIHNVMHAACRNITYCDSVLNLYYNYGFTYRRGMHANAAYKLLAIIMDKVFNLALTYMRHIPVMADFSHRYGCRGASTAHHRNVCWLSSIVKVLEKALQSRDTFTLQDYCIIYTMP